MDGLSIDPTRLNHRVFQEGAKIEWQPGNFKILTKNKNQSGSHKQILACLFGYTLMWHLMHSWPMFAQELPDIHLRLHFGHLYSPKQRFLPWYGVFPSPFGRACDFFFISN